MIQIITKSDAKNQVKGEIIYKVLRFISNCIVFEFLEMPWSKINRMDRENEQIRTALLDELVKQINLYIELRKAGNEQELLKCENVIKELSVNLRVSEDGHDHA